MGDRPDQLRAMWRATIAMCLAGAATLLVTLPSVFDPDPSDHGWMIAMALVWLGTAVVLVAGGPRPALVLPMPFLGILMISLLVAVARPPGAIPYFYLWPILVTAVFLDRRALIGVLVLFYATFAVALAVGDEPIAALILYSGTLSFTFAGVVVHVLQDRRNALVDELRRSAASDPLTGLLNRRGLEAAFDRDLERAQRIGLPLAVVVLDLDHFKLLNDSFGHAAGDDALAALGAVLRREARGGDAVARIGGEEFAVVLMDADIDGALNYVERVAAGAPHALSAGVVALSDEHRTREGLLLAADRALYAAKDAGRGCVVVHGDATPRPLVRSAALL
jgi:diguanylate cyclase (GGDEF)-like protein